MAELSGGVGQTPADESKGQASSENHTPVQISEGEHWAKEVEYWRSQIFVARTLNKITIAAAAITFVSALVALVGIAILIKTLRLTEHQAGIQNEALHIAERANIKISDWKIGNQIDARRSPVFSFNIENTGHTPAYVVYALDEFTADSGLPKTFQASGKLPNVPALIAQGKKIDIVLSGLPAIDVDSAARIKDGRSFIYVRVILSYRDIFGTRYELRSTGKYGRITNQSGATGAGFEFPDIPIPADSDLLDTCQFAALNKYNGFRRIEVCKQKE